MIISFRRLTIPLLGLPRPLKIAIVICVDISLCIFSAWLAYYLRLGTFLALSEVSAVPVFVSVFLAIQSSFRLVYIGLFSAIVAGRHCYR